jgi:hypothetical protein
MGSDKLIKKLALKYDFEIKVTMYSIIEFLSLVNENDPL